MSKVVTDLLELISTVEVPATTKAFKALKRFVVDVSPAAQVKISYVGDNFKSWFGKMRVDARSGSTLVCHALTGNAYDREILPALGGKAKCETTLAEIWQLMSLQGHGESGALLADRRANIFYVRDGSATLRTVDVIWGGCGWDVHVCGRVFSYWGRGRRVFVRSSCVR